MNISADAYLRSLLAKHQVNSEKVCAVAGQQITPILQAWSNQYLIDIKISGSLAKGTANAGTSDMDLFIALNSNTPGSLKEIFESLYDFASKYWPARKQNVSVGIKANGFHFDLVPARLQSGYQNWFSLWRNKAQKWTQTNIELQIKTISRSNRTEEIRILKLWRTLAGLSFPSFALELATLQALHGRPIGELANNVSAALGWISTNIQTAQLLDPANTNNIVSDDLTQSEKIVISNAAAAARSQKTFNAFVW